MRLRVLPGTGEFFNQGVAMASIIVISGTQKGDFYRLGQQANVIGRDESLPIQILDDHVSRRHLQILFDHRSWSYSAVDIGSANGVLINGARIDKETVLADGDCITIGDTSLVFTLKDFFDRESALAHVKKTGEWDRITKTD
jgi:pSer/pThr/pTyr-binding forkhead associated (FHA) protein